jgi:hypothetical protein
MARRNAKPTTQVRVNLSFTLEEYDKIKQAAEAEHLPVSTWGRKFLLLVVESLAQENTGGDGGGGGNGNGRTMSVVGGRTLTLQRPIRRNGCRVQSSAQVAA